jgi:hypothetical protein
LLIREQRPRFVWIIGLAGNVDRDQTVDHFDVGAVLSTCTVNEDAPSPSFAENS